MVYLIRKSPGPFAAVAEGRENTLLLGKNECVRIDEEIHFVEIEQGQRTGKECYGRVEYIYDKRLVKFRVYKHRTNRKKARQWNSKKRREST